MNITACRVRQAVVTVVALLTLLAPFGEPVASAATGSVLADFVPGGAAGNGRGIAFDGTNLYYTLVGDPHIYKVTTSGAPLGSITVAAPGAQGGPLSWDGSALWTADYTNTSQLLRVNPGSGAILSSCDFVAANPGDPAVTTPGKSIGSFPDGLDWTGSTNWLSGEGGGNPGNWDAELDTSCVIHNEFVPPPHGNDGTSGVAFVPDPFNGNTLWHAVPGEFSGTGPSLFQTNTSGVPTGLSFPAIHLTEDLAFDEITFAPKCALWANEATGGGPNHLTAYEIPCPERPISALPRTIAAVEGAPFSGTVATFSDPDPNATASEYAATIDWGDGDPPTAGTIAGPTGGPFTVSGTHTYKEEGPYPVTVTIRDVDTPTNTATAHSTANVADAALTAGTFTLNDGVEGVTPTTATFTFMDANPFATTADFTATFDWGDGSTSAGAVAGPTGGSFTVTGSHVYHEEGSYTVHVTVHDDGGSTTSATGTAHPIDAPIAAVCSAAAVSPMSFSGPVATLTDANPFGTTADFTATINWGDASSSSGAVTGPTGGPFTVSGTHTYGSTGFFTITVSIADDGGSMASTSCVVLIFGTSSGGNFVIGDGNSAAGTHVTFWGAQWAKLNTLSGGEAPSAFKGFENHPSTAPACRTDWTTEPGNSAPPPSGSLPDFMAVIVSSSISKSGPTISGNTPHVVVVHVNPGYAPNPGHAGTGTVVAVVC